MHWSKTESSKWSRNCLFCACNQGPAPFVPQINRDSARVWCAPAGPARTAHREPAPPSRSCWRAAACMSPSTRRNAVCRLGVGSTGGMAGQLEDRGPLAEAGRGWPRLGAAVSLVWRRRGEAEGEAASASGRPSSHMARRRRGVSTRCRERWPAHPRTQAPCSAQAAPRRW